MGQVDADHGAVGAVGGAEGIVDVDVAEGGQLFAEFGNGVFVSFGLVAVFVLGAAFFFDVEAEVLEEDDLAIRGGIDGGLDLRTDTVGGEGDIFLEEFFEFGHDGFQAVLGVCFAVGSTQVGHEDDGFGAMVDCVLDGGDGADDTLVVGDFLVGV